MTDFIQPSAFRSKTNLWLARCSEFARPLLNGYARHFCPSPPSPPTAWKTGILMGASHIGDVLYRTASLARFREGLPECSWYYLAASPADQVLLHNPHLAGVIPLPAEKAGTRQIKELITRRTGRIPDVALCYDSGGYWKTLVQAAELGIPNRVSYRHKGFSGLVTHPQEIRYPQSFPAYFRDLVADITGLKPNWPLRPQVVSAPEDDAAANAWWKQQGLRPDQPAIACFCTSRQPHGVLPLEKFIEVFRKLKEERAGQMILAGAKGDRHILERVNAEAALNSPILAGDLGLRALCSLLRKCQAVVTTDSGPRHLANAAGTPVVFVRNLSFSKVEAGIYLPTEHDLAPDVELIPPSEQARWMSQVSPAEMAARVMSILRESGS